MTDNYDEAKDHLNFALVCGDDSPSEEAAHQRYAQIYATLALVDQVRQLGGP